MSRLEHPWRLFLVVAAMGMGLTSAPALAHDPAHVDLQGVWMAFATVPSGRLGALSPELTQAGKDAVQKFMDENGGKDMPEAGWYCVGTGMPYIMTNLASYPIEIVQKPGELYMMSELEQQLRRVFLDGRQVPENYPRTRTGYSIGHWEGDTLVVETSNFKDWPLGSAPRSESAKITERFTLTTKDKVSAKPTAFTSTIPALNDKVLIDHLTIEDSQYYAKPLEVDVYYQTVSDKDTLEYDCTVDLWQRAIEDVKASEKKN